MKVLISELKKYIKDLNVSNEEIHNTFISLGFEVEESYDALKIDSFVKYSDVLSCRKHPNAEKLSFCKLKTDNVEYDVVCGGKNIKEGIKVLHATPGSKIGDIVLSEREIRGIKSYGMVLSIPEMMNISKDLIDENSKSDIYISDGKHNNIYSELDLEGKIFDLTILNDRNYAKNYLTIALESSVILDKKFILPNIDIKPDFFIEKDTFDTFKLNEIGIKKTFKVKDLKESLTPHWIKRLIYIDGKKAENNIDDLIHYIKLLTGVEIKKFDDTFFVQLDKETLFQFNFLNYAINLFIKLAKELKFISAASNVIGNEELKFRKYIFSITNLYSFIGQKLDLQPIFEKLEKLGFKFNFFEDQVSVDIPIYRTDIENKAGIIEEIIRFYSINNLPVSKPITERIEFLEKHQEIINNINSFLSKHGLFEVKNYKLVEKNTVEKFNIWKSKNLISLEEGYTLKNNTYQSSLMNGLLETYSNNFKKESSNIELFEISNIYIDSKPHLSLGILIDDFYQQEVNQEQSVKLLSLVEKIFSSYDLKTQKLENTLTNLFNKFNSVLIKKGEFNIAIVGEIHPSLLREYKLIKIDKIKTKLYYAEIILEHIL